MKSRDFETKQIMSKSTKSYDNCQLSFSIVYGCNSESLNPE